MKIDKLIESNQKILIVDDEEVNRVLLKAILNNDGYLTETASNGKEALNAIEKHNPDLILLDVMMPNLNGYDICKILKDSPNTSNIPVIMVTALTDKDSKRKGLDAGAIDFLNKPIDRIELLLRIKNILKIKKYDDFLRNYNTELESIVEKKTHQLKNAFIETIDKLASAAEHKDGDTALHIKRVSHYTKLIAKELGFNDDKTQIMFYGSAMHDIGKVGTPDHILLKTGKLTPGEFEIMKKHTIIGQKILANSTSEYLKSGELFALYHHERWNGTGYPNQLSENEIPIEGRIIHLADHYDALRNARSYKTAYTHEQTLEIIIKGDHRTKPTHFDPEILSLFKSCHLRFAQIYEQYKDRRNVKNHVNDYYTAIASTQTA
ncbi:MAG: response regulator [Planctomycetes bacterium]|nr:response regulator [Planctomycetota bacterium]